MSVEALRNRVISRSHELISRRSLVKDVYRALDQADSPDNDRVKFSISSEDADKLRHQLQLKKGNARRYAFSEDILFKDQVAAHKLAHEDSLLSDLITRFDNAYHVGNKTQSKAAYLRLSYNDFEALHKLLLPKHIRHDQPLYSISMTTLYYPLSRIYRSYTNQDGKPNPILAHRLQQQINRFTRVRERT